MINDNKMLIVENINCQNKIKNIVNNKITKDDA